MAYDKKSKPVQNETYSSEAKQPTHEGKHGDHPVGGAVGAAVGGVAGAVAAGAAAGAGVGAAAGPLGLAAGAGIGGVVGALAGKGIAQEINPTTEDVYWKEHYKDRPYVQSNESYDTYRPAYRYGLDAFARHEGRSFDEVEPSLRREWESSSANTSLPWDKARPATRDAYDRLCECYLDQDTKKA